MDSPLSCRSDARQDARRTGLAAPRRWTLAAWLGVAAALAAVSLPGCKQLHPLDTRPLDKAGMWYASIQELRELDVTDTEIAELAKAREAGVSDPACIELVRFARGHKQPFASGDAIVGLRRAGVSEATILELARLNQLGPWAGEAQAMRLAGLSEQTLLAVARRRAAGQPVFSGPLIAQLKNAGLSEAEIQELIERGTTDTQAQAMLAAHERAASSSGFVRYHRRRR